jgi:hypothetical protein
MKFYLIFAAFMLLASACRKDSFVDKNKTPECLERKIRQWKAGDADEPYTQVWKYKYNSETVYYVPPVCCDLPGILYDEKCNIICNPDGGITGSGDGQCPDFFSDRTGEELIWKKD